MCTKYFAILCLMFLNIFAINAQTVINEENSVRTLMDKFERLGKSEATINGWRIKIINTTDRRVMENVKFKFKQLYPNKISTSSYENPYYSIRTGAYENRVELESFLVELKSFFRNAIPVRGKINKQEIVSAMTDG
ncbi:MAG: hypothetical protein V3V00_14700 [Saprospiraceae bacterium]